MKKIYIAIILVICTVSCTTINKITSTSKKNYAKRVDSLLLGTTYPNVGYFTSPSYKGIYLYLGQNDNAKKTIFGKFILYDKNGQELDFKLTNFDTIVYNAPLGSIALPKSEYSGSTIIKLHILRIKQPKRVHQILLKIDTGEEYLVYKKGDLLGEKFHFTEDWQVEDADY